MGKITLLAASGGKLHLLQPFPIKDMLAPFVALCGEEMQPRTHTKLLYAGKHGEVTCPTCYAKYVPGGEPLQPPPFVRRTQQKTQEPGKQASLF